MSWEKIKKLATILLGNWIYAIGVVYFILVIAFRVITYDDYMLLPAGEKIAKILRVRA